MTEVRDGQVGSGYSNPRGSSARRAPVFFQTQANDTEWLVRAEGAWVIDHAAALEHALQVLSVDVPQNQNIVVDVTRLDLLDTAGAMLLLTFQRHMADQSRIVAIDGVTPDREILLDEVRESMVAMAGHTRSEASFAPLEWLGKALVGAGKDLIVKLTMLGQVIAGFGSILRRPRLLRGKSIVHHLDQAGLRAVPIIALMSFVIGAIVAQQSAYQLRYFGAEIFTVDLLGILVLRELGVLLTAIMVAGRSGSAFTAEIGSMKMREEIDALRVIGLSSTQVLIMPRVLALLIALPLLTVLANLFALLGGGLVAWSYSDIPPQEFIARLREAVWLETLMVGFIKAPFMAMIIAVIGCSEGLAVRGSAESLGRKTTASVVKSIFVVIVMDGIFAIFFASIGY